MYPVNVTNLGIKCERVVIFLFVFLYKELFLGRDSHYAKTKTQISFAVTAKLFSDFVFAVRIVQFLFHLNKKFQASSHLLSLCSLVRVGPGRKPGRPVFSQRGSYVYMSYHGKIHRQIVGGAYETHFFMMTAVRKWKIAAFFLPVWNSSNLGQNDSPQNNERLEPRSEKTGLRGFRPGSTQTGLYNYRRWLEI